MLDGMGLVDFHPSPLQWSLSWINERAAQQFAWANRVSGNKTYPWRLGAPVARFL